MNKKVLAALALVLVGLGYLALQPKGDIPGTVDTDRNVPAGTDEARLEPLSDQTELAAEPSSEGTSDPTPDRVNDVAVKLVETLHADKAITDVAIIQSVECADGQCTVELESKDEKNIQPTMMSFLERHPEYGTSLKVAKGENPRTTQFTFGKEKL
jgi:hypothetical protein